MPQTLDEVYSLLIPVAGGKLILPRVCVAEVMGYTRPRPLDSVPAWLLGLVHWQDQELPLVSFEGLCGRRIPERANRTRVAVVYGVSASMEPPVFALMTQGYPYLVRVNASVLSQDADEAYDPEQPVLARVHMANERPVIPDLEAIEDKLLAVLPHRRASAGQ